MPTPLLRIVELELNFAGEPDAVQKRQALQDELSARTWEVCTDYKMPVCNSTHMIAQAHARTVCHRFCQQLEAFGLLGVDAHCCPP